MTNNEEKQIAKYLLDKRLPVDMMLEVKDHMILQICEIQEKENTNFEDAFDKVKESWKKELKLGFTLFSNRHYPKIVRKILHKNTFSILYKAYVIELLIALLWILTAKYSTIEIFETVFSVTNFGLAAVTVLVIILNYDIILQKIRTKHSFSIYNEGANYLFLGIFMQLLICIDYTSTIKEMFSLLNNTNEISFFSLFTTIFPKMIFQSYLIFGLISFYKYKKVLKTMKPFISELE